jgi:hypothetical protein
MSILCPPLSYKYARTYNTSQMVIDSLLILNVDDLNNVYVRINCEIEFYNCFLMFIGPLYPRNVFIFQNVTHWLIN